MSSESNTGRGSKTTTASARVAALARWANTSPEERQRAASRASLAMHIKLGHSARIPVIESVCLYCGVALRGGTRKQCGSVECHRKYNAERGRETMRLRRARGLHLLPAHECASCGEMWRPTSPGIFCCSRACTNVMRYGSESVQPPLGRHSISRVKRLRIYERDNWTCYLCGYPVDRMAAVPDLEAPTLDHVVPLRSGGSNGAENLKTAHFYCNSVKGAKPLDMVA